MLRLAQLALQNLHHLDLVRGRRSGALAQDQILVRHLGLLTQQPILKILRRVAVARHRVALEEQERAQVQLQQVRLDGPQLVAADGEEGKVRQEAGALEFAQRGDLVVVGVQANQRLVRLAVQRLQAGDL